MGWLVFTCAAWTQRKKTWEQAHLILKCFTWVQTIKMIRKYFKKLIKLELWTPSEIFWVKNDAINSSARLFNLGSLFVCIAHVCRFVLILVVCRSLSDPPNPDRIIKPYSQDWRLFKASPRSWWLFGEFLFLLISGSKPCFGSIVPGKSLYI